MARPSTWPKASSPTFRRELDFRTGELRREFIWETSSGKQLQLVFLRLLSMETKELACQQIRLTPLNFSGPGHADPGAGFFRPAPHVWAEFLGLPAHSEDGCACWG